ncbi:carbohydrate-binding domain-containing protein [Mangrovibacterium marinum]|uniref:Uncharacterized protein DUF4353 n=1 Tax=Mangrovibacterium marinum TaxID=1639118 RepID=A0A2T5BVW4_9BACT|nr:carbohydrate-binding domain-containing protein [Mangrovibacterium marinum]PTN03791.1 uncharacterized protein DUF4353 [Mangrovibacterium marinum]
MKTQHLFFTIPLLFALLFSCTKSTNEASQSGNEDEEVTVVDTETGNAEDHEDATDYTWDGESATAIVLNTTSITVSGDGATANGTTATITAAGTYLVSGTLTNGKIIVDTEAEEAVKIVLNSVNITCSNSAPIAVMSAEKVVVILADGTENYLTDGSSYSFSSSDEDEPNAALFSKSDLSISGNGSLIIDANYNDGIASKDGLIIASGTIQINAIDDGIRGKDYLVIESGTIDVTAGGDGFKSDNDEDDAKGYISIESGTITITSGNDAMQATTDLLITDGTFNLKSGGGSSSYASSSESAKGLKADVSIVIETGDFTINSSDDAIHSGYLISLNDGTYNIASGDDGIHTDNTVNLNGGTINISKSYEGIEGPYINVNGGTIYVTASDDGLNASKGNGGESDDSSLLDITGGYLVVTPQADGLDSNGKITISGGTVLVHGASSSMEVGVDVNGTFTISGGFIAITGPNSNMTETPSSSSSQYSVLARLGSTKSSSTLFNIQDAQGNDLITFQPSRSYYTVLFSSSELANGSSYYINTGGSYSGGTELDGLYTGGTYSGGTQYTSFTISSAVSTVGSGSGTTGPGGTGPGGR